MELNRFKNEEGFTLIEFMIASIILVIGLLGLLALYTYALTTVTFADENSIAKQKARETLECIYTARNTSQISFDMINNVSNGGIFVDGALPLTTPGSDGLVGTTDDGSVEIMTTPGDDGIVGTSDDERKVLDYFTRQIIITQPATVSDLRAIQVIITFATPTGLTQSFTVNSLISRYR
jgi:prepilin-type N-terminal cleavage/methylation domain-containing protein